MFKTNQPKETMTKQKKLIQIKYPPFDKTVKTYADIFKKIKQKRCLCINRWVAVRVSSSPVYI